MLPPTHRICSKCLSALTFSMLVISGGAGCSHPSLLPAPHRYVRVDALLALHPSWEQIRSLDRELVRLKTAAQTSGTLEYTPHPSIPLFAPKMSGPANLATERAETIDLDAKRYLDSLGKSLNLANQTILGAERRREQRRVESAVAVRLVDAEKAEEGIIGVKRFALRKTLEALLFKEAVASAQVQDRSKAHTLDLTPLHQAQAELAAIRKNIADVRAADALLKAENPAAIASRQRDTIYREEQARSKERLTKREEELKADAQDKLAAARLQQRDSAIPPAVQPTLPPPDPQSTPLPLPAQSGAAITFGPGRVQPALERQAVIWQAQRLNLIAEIRSDTEKAVQQVAMRRGWTLEPGPRAGVSDATTEAADELRAQWTMGKAP